MAYSDTLWLSVRAGLKDLLLQEHHQSYNLFHYFYSVDDQTPQLITMIGGHAKSAAMRKMRFGRREQGGINGEIHLRRDQNTAKDDAPLLFADCELHVPSKISHVQDERFPGDVIRRPMLWYSRAGHRMDPVILAHMIYAKLIAPFSNVICIFSDDFGGLNAVAELLALWLMNFSNRPVDLPLAAQPRVLVLTAGPDNSVLDEEAVTRRFIRSLGREAEKKNGSLSAASDKKARTTELDRALAQQFGGIRVVKTPHAEASTRAWRNVKSRILQESYELHAMREQCGAAFSATHFKSFFQMASDHFCNDIISPFSFIKASRTANPVPPKISTHIASFTKHVDSSQLLNFAVPVIACALAVDCYPKGMHAFNPVLVFRHFFYQMCLKIDPRSNEGGSRQFGYQQVATAIEVAFCQYASEIIDPSMDGVSMHQRVLAKFKALWKGIFSNTTCLACLASCPENSLTCHHSLCTVCTRVFGRSTEEEPWTIHLDSCPLCCERNLVVFYLKPDTAGVRAMIVEGGGIKGIIPLSFLKELEHAIGLPMNIPEHFDIAFGSSSGALIVLGLFFNRWSVAECNRQFKKLSGLVFSQRKCFGIPFSSLGGLHRFFDLLLSFTTDSKYSSSGISKVLKDVYPEGQNFFETHGGGSKVGIVATTTDDSSTCLFTNYNGPENRSLNCGYRLVRPANARKEIAVWQAARASTAAPTYFKSYQGYQDGGLSGHNNPINLALWEQDTIWARDKKHPDIVLSLGTGFKRSPSTTHGETERLSFFQGTFVPRLFRSFMNFFVGETRWQELQNTLSPRNQERYHRLNIEFYENEPELDDVKAITGLEQQTKFASSSSDAIRSCADNLLASLFYMKLQALPEFTQSFFVCKATILCRLGPSHRALRVLVKLLKDSNAQFYADFEHSVPCVNPQASESIENGKPFSREITFRVMSLQDVVDVKIDGITQRAHSISNCPYKLETVIKDQRLDCVFGSRKSNKRTSPFVGQNTMKRVRFRR